MTYLDRSAYLKIVQFVTLTRIACAAIFVSVALDKQYHRLAIALYVLALITDVLDGRLARKLNVTTEFGAAFDGVADKYVTIASTLFLAALGLPLIACCMILLRDVVIQGLRGLSVDGATIFRPLRLLGWISGAPIRLLTLILLLSPGLLWKYCFALSLGTWAVAASSTLTLAYSIRKDWDKFSRLLKIES